MLARRSRTWNDHFTMHVLIVEDEQKIAAFVRRGLMENGFVVDVAEDGEQGLEYALAAKRI